MSEEVVPCKSTEPHRAHEWGGDEFHPDFYVQCPGVAVPVALAALSVGESRIQSVMADIGRAFPSGDQCCALIRLASIVEEQGEAIANDETTHNREVDQRTVRGLHGWMATEVNPGQWWVRVADPTSPRHVSDGITTSPDRLRELRDFIDALLAGLG